MDQQRTFFDADHAADMSAKRSAVDLRNDAVEAVASNRPDWLREFRTAIVTVANRGSWFTSDDVLAAFPKLEDCEEKRVVGAAFLRLSREGVIEAGGYVKSSRRESHARPKRQWRIVSRTEGRS